MYLWYFPSVDKEIIKQETVYSIGTNKSEEKVKWSYLNSVIIRSDKKITCSNKWNFDICRNSISASNTMYMINHMMDTLLSSIDQ